MACAKLGKSGERGDPLPPSALNLLVERVGITGGGYSDIDMVFTDDSRFCRRDGTEYPKRS